MVEDNALRDMFVAASIVRELVWNIFIVFLLHKVIDPIPSEQRKVKSGLIGLLLIPYFDTIWNFYVFPSVSKSFRYYFANKGINDSEDCGESLGLAYAIFVVFERILRLS